MVEQDQTHTHTRTLAVALRALGRAILRLGGVELRGWQVSVVDPPTALPALSVSHIVCLALPLFLLLLFRNWDRLVPVRVVGYLLGMGVRVDGD